MQKITRTSLRLHKTHNVSSKGTTFCIFLCRKHALPGLRQRGPFKVGKRWCHAFQWALPRVPGIMGNLPTIALNPLVLFISTASPTLIWGFEQNDESSCFSISSENPWTPGGRPWPNLCTAWNLTKATNRSNRTRYLNTAKGINHANRNCCYYCSGKTNWRHTQTPPHASKKWSPERCPLSSRRAVGGFGLQNNDEPMVNGA